jgi:hypothetical protein
MSIETARRQLGEGRGLEVGVDVLDDRVPAVGLVRGDRVDGVGGSVVVKNTWNRRVSH